MLKERENAGLHAYDIIGKTGQDVFNWWMEYDIVPGQTSMLESEEEDND